MKKREVFQKFEPPSGGWEHLETRLQGRNSVQKRKYLIPQHIWFLGKLMFLSWVLLLFVGREKKLTIQNINKIHDFSLGITFALQKTLQEKNPIGLWALGLLPVPEKPSEPVSLLSSDNHPILVERVSLPSEDVLFYRMAFFD